MAALLRITRSYFGVSKMLGVSIQTGARCTNNLCLRHASSTSNVDENFPSVVITDDGSTIACWHPEKEFPYEFSKPVPRLEPELNETDSVLKVQHRLLHKHRYNLKGPTRFELQALTYTTKHVWYPQKRIKYKSPPIPADRETL